MERLRECPGVTQQAALQRRWNPQLNTVRHLVPKGRRDKLGTVVLQQRGAAGQRPASLTGSGGLMPKHEFPTSAPYGVRGQGTYLSPCSAEVSSFPRKYLLTCRSSRHVYVIATLSCPFCCGRHRLTFQRGYSSCSRVFSPSWLQVTFGYFQCANPIYPYGKNVPPVCVPTIPVAHQVF